MQGEIMPGNEDYYISFKAGAYAGRFYHLGVPMRFIRPVRQITGTEKYEGGKYSAQKRQCTQTRSFA